MDTSAQTKGNTRQKFFAWQLPLILLLALALRLAYLSGAQGNALCYQIDSVEAYEVAAHFEAGDERAQYIGQPNCNPHSKLPGPLWTLFCVAGLKLAGSLQGVVLLMILANVAAIALTWRLARDLVDATAANFAALFMAVSLWAVQYSSIVWNPSLMPLFGTVILLALFRCARRENSRAIFALPLLLLVGAQFHMSTLSLIVPVILFIWLARLKVNWFWLAAGGIAALISYAPYLLGDWRHDWANTRGMLTGGNGGFSADALKVISSPFSFLINLWNPGWTYAPGEYASLAHRAFGGVAGLNLVNLLSVGFTVCLVLGVIQAIRAAAKNRPVALRERLSEKPGLLTAVFLLLAYLAFNLIAGKPFHSRYCLLVLPLLFTLAGTGAAQCLRSPRLKRIFLPLLLITVTADVWFMIAICRFERDRIASSSVFVASSPKMDEIYQTLKSRAPGAVQILDQDYLAALPQSDGYKVYRNAGLIRRYIGCRELEARAGGAFFLSTNFFELRASSLVQSNDPAVAFYGNGIALIAAPK